ncbi:MAG: glycosyltransferase family 39 protein [Nitrospirae bacterium]|nr:glycosyltransferase family 39 protein [Nitrospirota bacterium]
MRSFLPTKSSPGNRADLSVFLTVSLLSLLTYLVLLSARSLDDSRLTSWQYSFPHASGEMVPVLLITGLVSAFFFSKTSLPERCPAMFLFIASFGVSAIFHGEPEVIIDASRYFTQAKHLEVNGIGYFFREWGGAIPVWTDMPLVPFLYGLIFRVFGEYRVPIQIFNSLLFSLTSALTYFIGRTLWDERTGLTAGILMLGIPYLFSQVPLMLVDVPVMFFLLLSVYTFMKALEQGGFMTIVSAAAISLTFFSKYSAWLMLSVLLVIFFILLKQEKLRKGELWKRVMMILFIASLLTGVAVALKFAVFSEQIRLLMSFQMPGLRRWGESFLSTFFFQIHPWITIAALYSVFRAIKNKDMRFCIAIWLPLLVILFQIRRIRYIIMIFPMVCLAASYGLAQIRNREALRFTAFSIAAFSIVIAFAVHLPFLKTISFVNLKYAGQFLDSLQDDAAEVYILPAAEPVANPAVALPVLDLFTKKRLIYHYDPQDYPLPNDADTSSLRFTWVYKNPKYYEEVPDRQGRQLPVVIISQSQDQELSGDMAERVKGLDNVRVFDTSDGLFSHQTVVRIFHPRARRQ